MKIDLNLFVVFDTIYREGNITKAALALNLSQPAVSHALSKLRQHFDDALFVRQGNEMCPTSVAKNVIADIRNALQQLNICLSESTQFSPSTTNKRITLSLLSSLETTYLPELMQVLVAQAPSMHVVSHRRVRRNELQNKLASGDIDLAVDTLLPVSSQIMHQQIQQDQMVVVARKDHPAIDKTLNLACYLSQQHVLVSSRSAGTGLEDFELSRLGLQRNIALRCQHAFSACRIIASNDMLLTLSKTTAIMYSDIMDITIYPLPVELPAIDVHLYWHINADKDPANKWLRNTIIDTIAKM